MASQAAHANGHGNLIIQIAGDGNTVLDAAKPHLSLRTYTGDVWAKPSTGQKGGTGYTAAGQRETDLLSPFTRSFALRAREDVLARLRGWLDGPGIGVQVLTGPGGRGKTRLAVELCAAARAQGWLAGFATGNEMARFRNQAAVADWGWAKPLLVVVDYAAAKAPQIGAWLADLLHHPALQDATWPPLRLLLLERQGDRKAAWWRQAFGGPRVDRLLAADAPQAVPLIEDPALRWAVFAEGYSRAHGGAPPPRDARLDGELGRVSAGGEPLFLAMFGLMAARIGLEAAAGLASDEIALRMADEELARIRKAWAARGGGAWGDADLPGLLAALATLAEGWSEPEAHAAIARECAALHLGTPATEPLRAALHAALPGEAGGIAPVVPDILGGALAIRALATLPDRGLAAIRRAHGAKPDLVARMVIRACQDFVIRGQRDPLDWLRAVQDEVVELDGLIALADAIPLSTLELREAALAVTQIIVDRIGVEVRAGAAHAETLLAHWRINLSVRLSELGRREAALAASEEAVAILRRLAEARGDEVLPDLALAVNNLAVQLADLGRREAALAASEEAVAIRRVLAEARPDAFLPNLAGSLNNLSAQLANLGRREAALAASEEAVAVRRQLAEAHPDTFLPDLAQSLNNLSADLSSLGRDTAALAAIEEAVALRRRLTEARPDAFLPDLAQSLTTLSNQLSNLGRWEAALAAGEEAVALLRRLAEARPDAFLPDLAQSLNTLSNQLSNLGRREAALAASEEAVAIGRRLAEARPDAFLPGLATSLHNLPNCLSNLGRWEAALAASEEAVAIRRRLADARPDAFLPDLADSLSTLSVQLGNAGRPEAALAASEEAVALGRRLAQAHADVFLPNLAGSLHNLVELSLESRPS